MFKKSFSLMILAVALLSFNCSLKAMEDPQKNKQLDNAGSGSSEISYSVSERRASPYIWLSNESFLMIENHCACLEQFQEHAFLEITEENLKKYKELLCLGGINLNLVFSAIANCFKETTSNSKVLEKFDDPEMFLGITLHEINMLLLKILIKHNSTKEDSAFAKKFESYFTIIIRNIFRANLVDLYLLLAEGNIWPSLDAIQSDDNRNLLMEFVLYCEDIELFKFIINREKAKAYDWNNLFSMQDNAGLTVLHYAANAASKDIVEILLELMEEKGLDLEHFVYKEDNAGRVPLIIACGRDDVAIMELFINYITGLRNIINKYSVYSLKFRTALRYIDALKNRELDLSVSNELPEELKTYCNNLDSINKHCDLLANCTEVDMYGTSENLHNYKKLLHVIFDKENIDVNLMLSVFDRYFKEMIDNPNQYIQAHTVNDEFCGLSVMHINQLLTILIKRIFAGQDSNISLYEKGSLAHVINYAFKSDFDDLCLFLVTGNLLPSLKCIIDNDSRSFFTYLITDCKNMGVFNVIINKEKDKEYNWKKLFGIGNHFTTVLHYAVLSGSKDKVEVILNLMRDKGLEIKDFINIQDRDGNTPLMLANEQGHSEIADLLISNGATMNN